MGIVRRQIWYIRNTIFRPAKIQGVTPATTKMSPPVVYKTRIMYDS